MTFYVICYIILENNSIFYTHLDSYKKITKSESAALLRDNQMILICTSSLCRTDSLCSPAV